MEKPQHTPTPKYFLHQSGFLGKLPTTNEVSPPHGVPMRPVPQRHSVRKTAGVGDPPAPPAPPPRSRPHHRQARQHHQPQYQQHQHPHHHIITNITNTPIPAAPSPPPPPPSQQGSQPGFIVHLPHQTLHLRLHALPRFTPQVLGCGTHSDPTSLSRALSRERGQEALLHYLAAAGLL